MKSLRLLNEPQFPLRIVRPKQIRDRWENDGLSAFSVNWMSGRGCYAATEVPRTEREAYHDNGELRFRTVLVINAIKISPLAEVWDKNGLCRVWFNNRQGVCVEASKMNSWNKKPSDLRPVTSDFSDEALEKVLEIFDK